MRSLYRPGTSVIHRVHAGFKLAALALLGLGISLYPHDAISAGVVLLVVCLLYAVARLPVSVLAREAWQMRWLVVVLGGFLVIFASPLQAWVTTARVIALVLLAGLLTLTTRTGDLLDVLHRMLQPLRRLGIDVQAVAMSISLTITMIPVVAGFSERVREAQQARGVRLGIRGIVPLFVMTLRHADDVGDALAARGLC